MRRGGSKSKGSAWERTVSKILTKWLTGQDKEYYFYRSPGSGAVSTVNFGNKTLSGDIIAIKQEAAFFTEIFNIEAKNGYADASFDKFLKENKNDVLLKFWEQSLRDAKLSDKHPLVIFKKKGFPNPWIAFDEEIYKKLKKYFEKYKTITLSYENGTIIYFMNFSDFLLSVSPDIIRGLM